MPYIEQGPLYNQIASPQTYNGTSYPAFNVTPYDTNYLPWSAKIPVFLCPSDGESAQSTAIGRCSYHFSNGDYAGWWGDPTTRGPFEEWALYPDWSSWYTGGVKPFSSLTDGTSNTLGISERAIPGSGTAGMISAAVATNQTAAINYSGTSSPIACMGLRAGSQYAAGVATANWTQGNYSFGWQGRNAEISTILPPNSPSCSVYAEDWNAVMFTATSYHTGGVNTVFMDGSVHFISNSISTGNLSLPPVASGASPYGVWGSLGSKSGGEVVPSGDL